MLAFAVILPLFAWAVVMLRLKPTTIFITQVEVQNFERCCQFRSLLKTEGICQTQQARTNVTQRISPDTDTIRTGLVTEESKLGRLSPFATEGSDSGEHLATVELLDTKIWVAHQIRLDASGSEYAVTNISSPKTSTMSSDIKIGQPGSRTGTKAAGESSSLSHQANRICVGDNVPLDQQDDGAVKTTITNPRLVPLQDNSLPLALPPSFNVAPRMSPEAATPSLQVRVFQPTANSMLADWPYRVETAIGRPRSQWDSPRSIACVKCR
jgi:hypothetical protein